MTKTEGDQPALRDYQVVGVEWLRARPRALLGDEAGLGKTAQLIRASRGRTLVVAPAMIVDGGVWQDEAKLWADDPERFTVASYSSLLQREGRKLTNRLRPELAQSWDTLILDEAHFIKSRGAARTKAVMALSRLATRVYAATGTPIPNWPHEIYTLLCVLRPHDAVPGGPLGSYWRWIETWFTVTDNFFQSGVKEIGGLRGCSRHCAERPATDPCSHYRAFAEANLHDVFLQRMRDDVLTDLPPLTEKQVRVPMKPSAWRVYRELREDYAATLADGSGVVAWSAGARHILLDRLTTGEGVMAGEVGTRGSGKLEQLERDLSDAVRPVLVVAHYQASVESAAAVAASLGRSTAVIHGGVSGEVRGDIVRRFKAGQIDVLCGSLETIAEGLTLTAADTVIFLETSFRPSRNQQALRRIHRLGQTRPCLALTYESVSPSGGRTLDGAKQAAVAVKADSQMRALSAAQLYAMM